MSTDQDQNNFETAVEFWKGIALASLQNDWEKNAKSILTNQTNRLTSRKSLAEQTREFKKLPDQEKASSLRGLLKGYQKEIDTITHSVKESENAFLEVYNALINAPDPAPLFEVAIDQSVKLIDQEDLLQQNEALRKELKAVKENSSRLDAIHKKEIKAEDLSEKERVMKAQYDEKIKSYVEREHDLKRQLSLALDQLGQLRDTHDDAQAQLVSHNQKYEEDVAARLAELDVVVMELDRANDTIVQLRNKNEDLDQQNKELCQATTATDETQLDDTLRQLQEDASVYKNLYTETEGRLSKEVKDLTKKIQSMDMENGRLKKRLEEFKDYPEIARELAIMKYVEFSIGDDEDDDYFDGTLKKVEGIRESLETQLMEKNKRLESEKTELKVRSSAFEKDIDAKQHALKELQSKHQETTELVKRLEDDLLKMGEHPLSSSNSPSAPTEPRSPGVPTSSKDESNVHQIIVGQRDRLRKQNTELQEKSQNLEKRMEALKEKVDQLNNDNMYLSERLKFVHVTKNHGQGLTNRSTAIDMQGESSTARQAQSGHEDTLGRYDRLYEEDRNPFVVFRRKEERRRYNALNVTDKLTLKLTRMIVSHKWTRNLLVVYALLLHLLVVATLYQLSLWECRHDHEILDIPIANDNAAKFGQLPNAL